MNKPVQTTATNTATPTDYHKKASFLSTLGTVASIPFNAVRNAFTDDYGSSLRAKGYGKKK